MEYVKSHVAHTFENEWDSIQAQVQDTKITLNILQGQASDAENKKASAHSLLELLEDTRANQQERTGLRKLITKCSDMLSGIGNQTTRVQARLTQWEARAESFPQSELIKERKIRNMRHRTGKLQETPSRLETVNAFE